MGEEKRIGSHDYWQLKAIMKGGDSLASISPQTFQF
jgi:hypothetical protein